MSLSNEQIDICEKGNLEDIISLIDDGCDKNSILKFICGFGHLEVVKYLVEECGADVRANNYTVRQASAGGHLEVVKYLIEVCGADARANSDYAVQLACQVGHIQIVKYFVEKCGVNARTHNDWAVKCASYYGHIQVVKYLVEKCGVDARAGNDWTLSENNYFEVVKYLVEKCGAILPEVNPKYERYLIVYNKGEKTRKNIASKKIYFWWVRVCYNPNSLCGQRSMYKRYREYLSIR